jgi:hypothetical protein
MLAMPMTYVPNATPKAALNNMNAPPMTDVVTTDSVSR